MPKSHDKPWKVRERVVAAFHGLVRNPLSGENSGRVGDAYDPASLVPWVYLEVKLREAHSAISILTGHRVQVRKSTGESDPLCVLALAENRKEGFYLLIRSCDVVRYAVLLLERRGYTVTFNEKQGETDASHGDE